MSSKSQQAALQKQFIDLTQAIPQDAARLLKLARYDIQTAVNLFYDDATALRNSQRAKAAQGASFGPALEALFDQYWKVQAEDEREDDVWNMDATLAWCEDLQVDPNDPVMLAVAHLCQAKDMGKFDRKGWVEGWKSARKDTLPGQQEHVNLLRSSLSSDPQYYRKIYAYTFDYARGTENTNVRVLPLDTAAALWDLLLPHAPELMFQPDSAFNFHSNPDFAQTSLDQWKSFLKSPTGGKERPISKDVWNQFLDFALLMDAKYSKHDPENDAWPSLIDAFVEAQQTPS